MQISRYLKNEEPTIKSEDHKSKQSGFTLLECILAVGILSAMLASLVGLQSSIVYVAQNSMDKLKAVWSMRQAFSQLDYILDAGGLAAVPENSVFIWTGDKKFSVKITRKDLNDIKPSQFLITALKFFNLSNPNGNENLDVDQSIAPIAQFIDNTPLSTTPGSVQNTAIRANVNQSNFVNVFVTVNWLTGTESHSFSDGLFLLNNDALANLKLPTLPSGTSSGSDNSSSSPNSSSTGEK